MIKVVCIHNTFIDVSLTLNKVYDAELAEFSKWGEFYIIRNDEGCLMEYNTRRFMPLAKWREQQIKIVLDD